MKSAALVWWLAVSGCSTAQAFEYTQIRAGQSTLSFVSHQMSVPVEGRFSRFSSQLAFDPEQPDRARVHFVVDLASIDAGFQDANDEVMGESWLNVKAFPTATFVSDQVKSLGDHHFEAIGTLTLKGKARPVSAPFVFKTEETRGVFDGGFVLKRADYAIGEGPWADFETVANEISIRFHLVTTPSPTP